MLMEDAPVLVLCVFLLLLSAGTHAFAGEPPSTYNPKTNGTWKGYECGPACKDAQIACMMACSGLDKTACNKACESEYKTCVSICLPGQYVPKDCEKDYFSAQDFFNCIKYGKSGSGSCTGVKCKNKCDAKKGIQYINGYCDQNKLGNGEEKCIYEEKPCSTCLADGSGCMEYCDNAKDDDYNGLEDCKDPQCAHSFSCACHVQRGAGGVWNKVQKGQPASTTKLNIVFVGVNYDIEKDAERESAFKADLKEAMQGFGTFEPFSSALARIDFYAFRVPASPYAYYYMRPKPAGMAACKTGASAQYVVLDRRDSGQPSHAKLCGGIATIYTTRAYGEVTETVMHEFGHSFGCLWDEYVSAAPNAVLVPLFEAGYLVHKWRYDATNCATKAADVPGCSSYFEKFNTSFTCSKGCTSPSWWRPSENSVMVNALYPYYNNVSQKIIGSKLAGYW